MSDADEDRWRIDELAQRSGVSVDTVRFYQRDGLLPAARRQGRLTLYGPAHLRRIEQIRDLQARHFNLAAVKALLSDSRLGAIQAMFSSDEGQFTRAELAGGVGLDLSFVRRVESTGLLVDPEQSGRTGYDQADLDMLDAIRRLVALGMPEEVVLFMARLYAEHFASMQDDVAALFRGDGTIDWPDEDRRAFIDQLGGRVSEVFELTARLLNYAHHATVRRMTLATPLPGDADRPG